MVTIDVEVGSRTVKVVYEPFDAHEPFGEGGYDIDKIVFTIDMTEVIQPYDKRQIKESFKQALCLYELLECYERDGFQTYAYEIPDDLGYENRFDYPHQLEERVTKLVLMLEKTIDKLNHPFQTVFHLGFYSA
ncbi:hypothetical protein [Sporosarcina sp. JAI121]|uniref:hypothetical protein n=1 Tax=Sporosarcina sp. JAI121 TaxID=2723064 RepID=UPI0015C6FBD1|nr:hypothetical protein [Sporosarcina sp. JAI121]NYF23557.1 hypothetical protein [Sporosarcina sp. JAI121]